MRLLFFLGKARPPAREAATSWRVLVGVGVRAFVALPLVGIRGRLIPSIARATAAGGGGITQTPREWPPAAQAVFLVFEVIAQRAVDLAGVVVVEAAEGEGVVEQDAAVG